MLFFAIGSLFFLILSLFFKHLESIQPYFLFFFLVSSLGLFFEYKDYKKTKNQKCMVRGNLE